MERSSVVCCGCRNCDSATAALAADQYSIANYHCNNNTIAYTDENQHDHFLTYKNAFGDSFKNVYTYADSHIFTNAYEDINAYHDPNAHPNVYTYPHSRACVYQYLY